MFCCWLKGADNCLLQLRKDPEVDTWKSNRFGPARFQCLDVVLGGVCVYVYVLSSD